MQTNKRLIVICAVLLPLLVAAQSLSVVIDNKQQKFHKQIPAANYSGITNIGNNRFALVDDKSTDDGYYIFQINIDDATGKIEDVVNEGFVKTSNDNTDLEGIAYVPAQDSIYTKGEKHTGIESFTYNQHTHRFWTTTEVPLPADGKPANPLNPVKNLLRLVSYDDDMNRVGEYLYEMDMPEAKKMGSNYVFGVSELCALDDGKLLVLEREFYVAKLKIGAWCNCKIYIVDPLNKRSDAVLDKELLWCQKSKMTLFGRKLANYEGMCIAKTNENGNIILLLVADSQHRYKGVMKDWFKTLVLRSNGTH